ncbi:MAG TPA: hypothetical protein VH593_09170, partial [Ktedonobacteraceae bacterium]
MLSMYVAAKADQWLDAEVSQAYKNEPLAQDNARVQKVVEEIGETIAALIGYTGQNPRKGIINNRDDVCLELADTVWTAILG